MRKKLFAGAVLYCAMQFTLLSSDSEPTRLIVRADDMGSSRASNIACLKTSQEGVATSIEVMAVGPWFPETVRILRANPEIAVGLHLTLTSEWDLIKWRPLTSCPSLVDENGYFFPQIRKNSNYPGQSISEHKWNLAEIEQEFRAQIELALRNLPQITHLSSHMGCTTFDKDVAAMVSGLAKEYNLTLETEIENLSYVTYKGSHKTLEEKEASFLKMLETLEKGKNYLFVDHPALDTEEMQGTFHIGYEDVARDRQGVTDLFTSPKIKAALQDKNIELATYNQIAKALPRSTPEAENVSADMLQNYLAAVEEAKQGIHSVMVLRNGKVIAEKYLGEAAHDKNHVMYSVSKTFTATAIGFAVQEGRIQLSDKVISFFPEDLPENISDHLRNLEIRHLLTMSVGHGKDPTQSIRETEGANWMKGFLAVPLEHQPGTRFVYNSLATYALSAIVQKVTGEKVVHYLYPRLFRPLGIASIRWEESPQGINCGGWGLWLKTEDMAKMGQFLLQKGVWNGKQLLSKEWIEEATQAHINQPPVWVSDESDEAKSDWRQGYGYQLWRCRHNAFRADGAFGQFIIVIPEKETVITVTAQLGDMQAEINLIWEHILSALK